MYMCVRIRIYVRARWKAPAAHEKPAETRKISFRDHDRFCRGDLQSLDLPEQPRLPNTRLFKLPPGLSWVLG